MVFFGRYPGVLSNLKSNMLVVIEIWYLCALVPKLVHYGTAKFVGFFHLFWPFWKKTTDSKGAKTDLEGILVSVVCISGTMMVWCLTSLVHTLQRRLVLLVVVLGRTCRFRLGWEEMIGIIGRLSFILEYDFNCKKLLKLDRVVPNFQPGRKRQQNWGGVYLDHQQWIYITATDNPQEAEIWINDGSYYCRHVLDCVLSFDNCLPF